jgi:hydroxyethylthiazole kinase-like uncharacterized protein yjeF
MSSSDPTEVLTPEEMAEADRLAIAAGTSGFELMRRAGLAVAEAAQHVRPDGPILVVAGPGNNGGDGFVAASELRRWGRDVRVALLGERSRLAGDAATAARQYEGPLITLGSETDLSAGLVIDALFGAGLSRPLEGLGATTVERLNRSGIALLAVDLPSGIDGRTGEARGPAVRALRSVTFFRLKPGHLLLPGRVHAGVVQIANIGIEAAVLDVIRPSVFHNGPALWRTRLRTPSLDDHKYARGHAFVVSGPAGATGAARLAAAGSIRVGAGAATVLSPPDAMLANAAHLTSIMLRRLDGPAELVEMLADPRPTAIVIGPGNGVGAGTRALATAALESNAGVVLDADALTSFAADRDALFAAIRARSAPVVLTPHEGEFARLFAVTGPKLERARTAARESGATLVLKGADTIIAEPSGRAVINSNAPPDLATAGSGDVLAGMIAGLLAQGLSGPDAAAAAVWLHGAAGAALGHGLIAEDLPGALPSVLQGLRLHETD